MEDNVALRWSEYDSAIQNIRIEERNRLTSLLQSEIEVVRSRGLSEHFCSGMELAKGLVSGEVEPLTKKSHNVEQDSLF